MSRFYSGLHVLTENRDQLMQDVWMYLGEPEKVSEELQVQSPKEARHLPNSGPDQVRAFLSPAINGWISMFMERLTDGERVAEELSTRQHTWTVLLWTDPARAWGYTIFRNGDQMDEFVNNLAYWDGNNEDYPDDHLGGQPREYEELIENPNDVNDLINLLQLAREVADDDNLDTSEKSVERIENEFEMFRKALGIPHARSDYEYLIKGDSSDLLRWEDFVHIAI